MDQQIDSPTLRLLILSPQALLRTSLARLLATEPGFEVVRECGTANEALETLGASPVDIVLLDLPIGNGPAEDFVSQAQSHGYAGKYLMMAEALEADALTSALKSGASGIFRKSEAPDRLVLAIRLITAGAVWLDQSVVHLLDFHRTEEPNHAGNQKSGRLEDREAEIIRGIMDGLTTRRIGDHMGLSEGKVKNILQGLFARTGVRKRSQLVRLALDGSLGMGSGKLKATGGEAPAGT